MKELPNKQLSVQVGGKNPYIPPMITVIRLGLTENITGGPKGDAGDTSGMIAASGNVSGFKGGEDLHDEESEDSNQPPKVW